MKYNFCLPVIILLSLFLSCKKQDTFIPPPSINKLYGGSQVDWGQQIIASGDGNYMLAANTNSDDGDVSGFRGYRDYWLVKVGTSGNIIWQKTYGGSDDDQVSSVVAGADGGYVMAGRTGSFDGDVTGRFFSPGSTNYFDAWVVKVDVNGNILWQKAFGGLSFEIPVSIIKSSDGGYMIAGYTSRDENNVSGDRDAWIVKLDRTGNIIWQKKYGGTSY